MTGEQVPCLVGGPVAEINVGAILKGVSDCVQNVRLDPERVSGFASPNAQTARRGNGFARGALRNDLTRGVGVLSLGAGNLAQHEALLARRVALVEGDAIGQVFDDVAIESTLNSYIPSGW